MWIIALLISISLTIALLFLSLFIWSMRSGQYDDTFSPSARMLFDDPVQPRKKPDQNQETP